MGTVCAHASVNYTYVLFAGSDKFPAKEDVHGVHVAAAEGRTDPRYGVSGDFAGSEGLCREEHHDHRVI